MGSSQAVYWLFAVENGGKDRKLPLRFDFVGKSGGALVGFADTPDRPDGYVIERRNVGPADVMELKLRRCGGYAAMITLTGTGVARGCD